MTDPAETTPDLFSVYNGRGERMYMNMARDARLSGYSWRWRGSNGFVTDDQIAREIWTVKPQHGFEQQV